MSTKCRWCGEDTGTDTKKLCKPCKDMRTDYNYRRAHLFHTTPVGALVRFRNQCMDMVNMRERGAKRLPDDLDYQLERVNRYLDEKEDLAD